MLVVASEDICWCCTLKIFVIGGALFVGGDIYDEDILYVGAAL